MNKLITKISQEDVNFSPTLKQKDVGRFTVIVKGILFKMDTLQEAETFISLPHVKSDLNQ